ncbi:hypothetical protein Tco_0635406 [Tanacetum coccineum]
MASLDYRLNLLFTIKECSSCGSLYNKGYCCTPDSSQQPLHDCPKCGNPVEGPNCQGCALWRKKLQEVWFTICHENGIYQDLLNTYESSNDNTNIVSAPQEPFVFNQDPGKNSSQSPPHIDHCCYGCDDSLDDIFCQRCTCESCGKGAHYGYNCPPQVPIISKPEPCNNQTVNEFPQTLPSVHLTSCSGDENSFTYDSKPNFVDDSPNVFNPPPQSPMYSCEFCRNNARYGHYCTPQVPFIYPGPCYNQDFNFPQDFHDFQQQYLCCENCGGPHETFQCQPMTEDYYHEQNSCYDSNSFGFDQFQPPQYTVNHPIFNAQNEFLNSQNKLMEQMTSICDMVGQIMQKKEEERRIAEDQAAKDRYWKIPICYDDDEEKEGEKIVLRHFRRCDVMVPFVKYLSTFDALNDHSEILSDSNDDDTSSDDNDFEDIEYVSFEEVNDVDQEENEFDLEDILQIQDVILREKLLNISRLITNIESLNDNPTLDRVLKSPSLVPNSVTYRNSFFAKLSRSGRVDYVVMDDNSDNSANGPLLGTSRFESFHFDPSFPHPPPEPPDVEICLNFEPDTAMINNFDELNEDEYFDPEGGLLDFEDSRTHGFVHSFELHILNFI